ncbi:MAG: DUF4845 domain-containing protein [Nitrosomonadales bacterium]|nr:DUF4845 domain-containing protein [Nitrosomonadales bacterium]
MPATQRGIGFSGFIFGAFLLVMVSMLAFKLIPAYMEYQKIKNTFVVLATDLEMQKASPRELQLAFGKRADIDDIHAVKAEDIEISNEGGKLVLSASYSVKVPLVANISLFLDFNPSSAK